VSPENENDHLAPATPNAPSPPEADVQGRLALSYAGRRLCIGSDPDADRNRALRETQSSHPLH
jgi:phosphomannomutase